LLTTPSVIFGSGTLDRLPEEVRRLGGTRVLLITDPGLAPAASRIDGSLLAGTFDGAAMHTPVEVTERARGELKDADCLVTLGGGSATGLGKALSVRTGLPHIAIPSTYAGSEVTPVLGETAEGRKTTRSEPAIRPDSVIYDVDLTLTLPVPLSVTSGVNAMAHAVEALYSPDSDLIIDQFAMRALTLLSHALPLIVADPADRDARTDALLGAYFAGLCLGSARMGLHHKLAHLLGGTYGMPHSETHAVLLPHVMAYESNSSPDAMRKVADALGVPEAPAGMYDLIARLGGPLSLRELGLERAPDDHAVLREAFEGQRPNGRADSAGPPRRWWSRSHAPRIRACAS
jgi:alcohol dehydrogenase class IV